MDPDGVVLALTPAELGADAMSARRARRWVSDFLRPRDAPPRVDPEVIDDVLLVVSELVTNVVLHTHGPPALSVRVEPDRTVRVEIVDRDDTIPLMSGPLVMSRPLVPGPGGPANWPTPDPMSSAARPGDGDRIGGHGLRIVASIASRWGIEPHGSGGKTVWAVFKAMSAKGSAHQRSYS